jgi:hypothetical protein
MLSVIDLQLSICRIVAIDSRARRDGRPLEVCLHMVGLPCIILGLSCLKRALRFVLYDCPSVVPFDLTILRLRAFSA